MNTLITGTTGFLGSHIADAFHRAGHSIRSNYRSRRPDWLTPNRIEWIHGDLREHGALDSLVRGCDAVIHNAGITRARSLHEFREVNTIPTVELARRAADSGVSVFVFVSSMAAREPDELRTAGIPGPISDYGRSKQEAEEFLRRLAEREAAMRIVVLRLSGVYGPRDRDLFPMFRMAASGICLLPPKKRLFQPVFAADAAGAMLAAVHSEATGTYEIAEERQYSWPEVGELMRSVFVRSPMVFHVPTWLFMAAAGASTAASRVAGRLPLLDPRRAEDLSRHTWTCDPKPAHERLGWRSTVPLAEGLARTAEWYRSEGWL